MFSFLFGATAKISENLIGRQNLEARKASCQCVVEGSVCWPNKWPVLMHQTICKDSDVKWKTIQTWAGVKSNPRSPQLGKLPILTLATIWIKLTILILLASRLSSSVSWFVHSSSWNDTIQEAILNETGWAIILLTVWTPTIICKHYCQILFTSWSPFWYGKNRCECFCFTVNFMHISRLNMPSNLLKQWEEMLDKWHIRYGWDLNTYKSAVNYINNFSHGVAIFIQEGEYTRVHIFDPHHAHYVFK